MSRRFVAFLMLLPLGTGCDSTSSTKEPIEQGTVLRSIQIELVGIEFETEKNPYATDTELRDHHFITTSAVHVSASNVGSLDTTFVVNIGSGVDRRTTKEKIAVEVNSELTELRSLTIFRSFSRDYTISSGSSGSSSETDSLNIKGIPMMKLADGSYEGKLSLPVSKSVLTYWGWSDRSYSVSAGSNYREEWVRSTSIKSETGDAFVKVRLMM